MSPESFDFLLSKVGPLINKQDTRLRQPISAAERLALTIRYLASGDSQQSMSFSYRMGKATVSNIIQETCQAIWDALNEEYLRPPTSTLPMNTWNCGIFLIVSEVSILPSSVLETVALSFTTTKGSSVSSSWQCVMHIMFSPW